MTYSVVEAPVAGGTLRGGRWRPEGDAPAVLLVHGVTAHHGSWFAVADAAPDLDLVAPDLRGRGGSRSLPGPAGMREHADDLAALLDHLGLDRVVVAGHSMGAFVSVVMADRHPDRVSRLVLVDGGLPLDVPPGMSTDEVIAAVLGPAVQRLSMVFPTREAYVDFWRAHPAFSGGVGPGLAAYFEAHLGLAPEGFALNYVRALRGNSAADITPGARRATTDDLAVGDLVMTSPTRVAVIDRVYNLLSDATRVEVIELRTDSSEGLVRATYHARPIDREGTFRLAAGDGAVRVAKITAPL